MQAQRRTFPPAITTRPALTAVALVVAMLLTTGAYADHRGVYERNAPRIDMLLHGRDLHAIDGTRLRTFPLMRNEKVLWIGTADRLAVAVTDNRLIAITTQWKEWQTRRFGVHESLPTTVLAGDDFVLAVTDDRVLSISDHGASFVEKQLGPYEQVADIVIGDRVGLVLTDRRAIGFSGRHASLVDEPVGIHEELFRARSSFDFATVVTSKRLLFFDAPSGSWQSHRVSLP